MEEQITTQEQELKKTYREIPREEKFKAVLMVLAKKKSVKQITAEMGISRQAFREWKKIAMESIAKAFLEEKKRGRKPKGYVPEDKLRENAEEMKEKELMLEQKVRQLEAEREKAQKELMTARQALDFYDKKGTGDAKKNDAMTRLSRKMLSEVPKRLSEGE